MPDRPESFLDPVAEREMRAWMACLERVDAPPTLKEAVLAPERQEPVLRLVTDDGLMEDGLMEDGLMEDGAGVGRSRSAWRGVAAAAAVALLALGVFGLDRAARDASPTVHPTGMWGHTRNHADPSSGAAVLVQDDPGMALYHSLDSLDAVGAARGELIAGLR